MIRENTNASSEITKEANSSLLFWLLPVRTISCLLEMWQLTCLLFSAEPAFTHKPRDIEASDGSRVEVTCEASGEPEAKIVWKKKQGEHQMSLSIQSVCNPWFLFSSLFHHQDPHGLYSRLTPTPSSSHSWRKKTREVIRVKQAILSEAFLMNSRSQSKVVLSSIDFSSSFPLLSIFYMLVVEILEEKEHLRNRWHDRTPCLEPEK